jgi:hypothetical protein
MYLRLRNNHIAIPPILLILRLQIPYRPRHRQPPRQHPTRIILAHPILIHTPTRLGNPRLLDWVAGFVIVCDLDHDSAVLLTCHGSAVSDIG